MLINEYYLQCSVEDTEIETKHLSQGWMTKINVNNMLLLFVQTRSKFKSHG
jgi:hypothetical protein